MDSFSRQDRQLERLFADAARPLPDDGFSVRVVNRLVRRQRLRTTALGAAVGLGALVWFGLWDWTPLLAALAAGGEWLISAGDSISQLPAAGLLLAPLAAATLLSLLLSE